MGPIPVAPVVTVWPRPRDSFGRRGGRVAFWQSRRIGGPVVVVLLDWSVTQPVVVEASRLGGVPAAGRRHLLPDRRASRAGRAVLLST